MMTKTITVAERETDAQKVARLEREQVKRGITARKCKDALLDISNDLDEAQLVLDKAWWVRNELFDLVETIGKNDLERENAFMHNRESICTAVNVIGDYLFELRKAVKDLSDKVEEARGVSIE